MSNGAKKRDNRFWVRVIAWVLAGVMLVTIVFTAVYSM